MGERQEIEMKAVLLVLCVIAVAPLAREGDAFLGSVNALLPN
jgi:hypothetical protein